jgi:uncharacterized protein (DUF58 family)
MKIFSDIFRNLFLTLRFFMLGGIIVAVFIFSYSFSVLYNAGILMLLFLTAAVIADIISVFNNRVILNATRRTSSVFSLGSENNVLLEIDNKYNYPVTVKVIDEIPFQFQERNFQYELKFTQPETQKINYHLRPVLRGEYRFGKIHIYIRSVIGLVERRISHNSEKLVKVYPSIAEMKNMELLAFPEISHFTGVKKIRRLGHSYEFEQIKNYETGDDIRSINWKATGRRGNLMVNHYEDEKAQQVYCIIDKSRAMKMPFNNLSLLDYAINSSLAISKIALHKHDKAGLITFSDRLETRLSADGNPAQMKRILEVLYNEQEKKCEANYEALYLGIRNQVKGRSLLFLYTNFESYYAMERVLPVLRKINRSHLLVVIFFENSEIIDFTAEKVVDVEGIYNQTIAQKFLEEKMKIIYELKQFGIQSLYTRPEHLSVNTVNKYLELKARGSI